MPGCRGPLTLPLLQFDTYDPEKIHSHPGVREDLFPRPLRQTLVTDFFGGVAQAEVLPELLVSSIARASNTTEPDVLVTPVADPVEAYRTNDSHEKWRAAPTKALDAAAIFESRTKTERTFSATSRAWASVTLAGSLVAWVVRTNKH